MKQQRLKKLFLASVASLGILVSATAATITVNTVNNADFSPGVTNLWLAITMANTNGDFANTINFNIAGAGPHYLVTPQLVPGTLDGGYPVITNNNLTINGYTQPGSLANTNTILGSNTAALKVVIDSRALNYAAAPKVGANSMNIRLITGKTYGNIFEGYTPWSNADAAQFCIYQATNVNIKGLCFLNDYVPGLDGLNVASISLAAEYPTNWTEFPLSGDAGQFYPDYSLHVNGCWFNLQPDGATVVDGGYNAVRVMRHRAANNQGDFAGRWSPSDTVIGVGKNSANPRAEFNIIMSQADGVNIQGRRTRYCGNFFNVLANGMNQYFPDPQRDPGAPSTATVPTTSFIGGSYAGYDAIGTDGDGINDAEERNIFAGLPRKRSASTAQINHATGCYHMKVAGNYFGVAVDGITRWTNSSTPIRIGNRPTCPTNNIFGSDFDGVSDAIEANVICNNWPLDYWFQNQTTEPNLSFNINNVLSPYDQPGAPPETLNSDKQGENAEGTQYQFANSFLGNKLINNFTAPISPFACWREIGFPAPTGYFPPYTNVINYTAITYPGTPEEGATNFITVVNPVSSTRRLKGIFPLGKAPYTNVIVDVYVANAEGLINGAKFQTLTNTLPVWAQGESVLAYNLQADTAFDLDPATGAFNFNLSQYQIPAGTKVTVTASYAKAGQVGTYMAEMQTSRFSLPVSLVGVPNIVITSIVNNGNGTATITWTGGDAPYIVEKSTSVTSGGWTLATTTSSTSAIVPIDSTATFFRVQ